MRRLLLISIFAVLALSFATPVSAREPVTVYFFYGDGCPHCAKEEVFLSKLQKEKPEIQIQRYEVWHDADNQKLLAKIASELKINSSGIPVTIVNGKVFYGYAKDETTGQMIKSAVEICQGVKCADTVAPIIEKFKKEQPPLEEIPGGPMSEIPQNAIPEKIKIPFFGEIETKSFSLPLLTVVIGGIDGFNPCAMWALLFLISLLFGMENRKKMWVLGSVFIAASALSYFIFMAAWLNVFLFLGLIFWARAVIGGVAIFAGIHQLRKHWGRAQGGCPAAEQDKKGKVFERLKQIVQEKNFLAALGGIIILAFSVNLLEIVCSAGLPAIYTQVLSITHLAKWQYYAYILLYIFFYMLDDLVVFAVAMVALKSVGISTKYGRYSALVGGVIMLILGILLILKPGWLMFG